MSGAAEDESKAQGTSATDNGDENELSAFGQHNVPNKSEVSRQENQGHGFTFSSDKKSTAGSATLGPKKEDKQAKAVTRNFKMPLDEPGKPSALDNENKEEHRVPSPSQKDSSLTGADERPSASANSGHLRDNSDSNMPSPEDRISKLNSLVDQIANICGLIAPPMSSPRLSHPAGAPQNNDDNDRLSARYRLCRVDSLLDQIADISRPRSLAPHPLLRSRPPRPSGTPQYFPKKPRQPSERQPDYTEVGRPLKLGSIDGLHRLEKFLVSLRPYKGSVDNMPLSKVLAEAKYFYFCIILRRLTFTTIPLDEDDHDQDTVAQCELLELVDSAIFALEFATEICQSLTEMHQKKGGNSSPKIPDSKRHRKRQKAQAWLEEQNTQQTQPVDEVDQEHGAADRPDEGNTGGWGAVDDESDTDGGGAVDDESDSDGTGEDGRSDADPPPANDDLPVILTAADEPDRLIFPVALVIYAARGLPDAERLTHIYKSCAEMRRSFLTHLEAPPYPDDVPVTRKRVGIVLQSAEDKLKLACQALEEVLTKGPLPPQLNSEVESGMPIFISYKPRCKAIKRFNIFGKKGIRSLD